MKNFKLFLVIVVLVFLGCTRNSSETKQKKNTVVESTSYQTQNSKQKLDTIDYDFSYVFSNDTICQFISIKILDKSKNNDDIPKKLDFKLVLKNKLQKKRLEIKGIASLTSPNESFLDDSEPEDGSYFAADYNKNNSGYIINISLDIENYEACAVSLKADSDLNLKDFINPKKIYPDYNVLKRGVCN
jgi:hypothetical protein